MPSARTPAPSEPLEPRRLLAASPLLIEGTEGADVIRVRQTGSAVWVARNGSLRVHAARDVSSIVVEARGGDDLFIADPSVKLHVTVYGGDGDDHLRGGPNRDRLHGEAGADRVYGGAGNDQLYGGEGTDTVSGGDGDDVLVTLGGDADRLAGNGGRDNFWADAGGTDPATADALADLAAGDVRHAVPSFMSYRIRQSGSTYRTVPVPTELAGQELDDPVAAASVTRWADVSDGPLFASGGPSEHDIDQNLAEDCYFMAGLSSIAKLAPEVITDNVVELGDGTYGVHFRREDQDVFLRVDGDMPASGSGALAYAGLGEERSAWVPVIEKAFAFFRESQGTYVSINWGKMSEAYDALGLPSLGRIFSTTGFDRDGGLLEGIAMRLARGDSMLYSTLDVQPQGSRLRPDHILMIDRVIRNDAGQAVSVVLRDPHKNDGAVVADGVNDGYITITAAEAAAWMEAVSWCRL